MLIEVTCRKLYMCPPTVISHLYGCVPVKVGVIRNQHPYVIDYVSAKSGKIFNFRKKKIFEAVKYKYLALKKVHLTVNALKL